MSNDVLWTELVRVPEDFLDYEISLLHDMLCAIRSVEAYHTDLYLDDFAVTYKGPLPISELSNYDDGIDKWLVLNSDSSFEDITAFRGYQWLVKASKWIETGIPPVVAITVREIDQIGDGRGRINMANVYSFNVPLYHIIHKDNL